MNVKPSRFSLLLLLVGCGGGAATGSAADAQAPLDSTTSLDGAMQEATTEASAAHDAADAADGAVGADGGADSDGTITDAAAGDGVLGAPCATNNQCTGALCLGGAFAGGYCSSPVAECDSGGAACADGGLCTKSGAVDVDGAAQAEFCLVTCQGSGECRQGYSCCYGATYAQMAGLMVCVPPSLCPDQ
jgi:hypothetical protein